jgi:ABC-type phosphate/phosphonate transport system ATPase subunit
MSYADRVVALRAGRVVADAPAASLDARAIEQIHARSSTLLAGSARS